jgi:hypothetical protein
MTESIIPEKFKEKIKKRILKESDYSFEANPSNQEDINLTDNIILYNSGNQWKIIPLIVCLSYPIIYENYVINNEKYEVSIVVCPVTLRCVMFKERFEFYDYNGYQMVLKGDNDFLPINMNKKINKNFIIQDNKRIEIKIMTMRNAILYAPDALIINCKKKIKPIIKLSYYTNNKNINNNILKDGTIHPKTLVYIVIYSSLSHNDEERHAILLGNDSNKDFPTGYDIIKSKLNEHLVKYRKKIIKKDGYIMPMLWYIAKSVYKNYKIVFLK